jgi:hypothetical protein
MELIDELYVKIKEAVITCALTLGIYLKLLCRTRELILRELGFSDIFKKVKVNSDKNSRIHFFC